MIYNMENSYKMNDVGLVFDNNCEMNVVIDNKNSTELNKVEKVEKMDMDTMDIYKMVKSLMLNNFEFEQKLLTTKRNIIDKIEELKCSLNKYEELNKIKNLFTKLVRENHLDKLNELKEPNEEFKQHKESFDTVLNQMMKDVGNNGDNNVSGIDNSVNLYNLDKLSENTNYGYEKLLVESNLKSFEDKLNDVYKLFLNVKNNSLNEEKSGNILDDDKGVNLYDFNNLNTLLSDENLMVGCNNLLYENGVSLTDKILNLINKSNYKIPLSESKIDFTQKDFPQSNISSNLV